MAVVGDKAPYHSTSAGDERSFASKWTSYVGNLEGPVVEVLESQLANGEFLHKRDFTNQ